MMISPETFYDEVREKSVEEIHSEIRSLKRTINSLKKEVERPDTTPDMVWPSRETVIYWSREYLVMARKALGDAGGIYKETDIDRRQREFLEDLPRLQHMELEIGGLERYSVTVEGDAVKFNGELEPKIQEEPIETKDQLMEKIRDIHLEEWRKEYSPEQYGIAILDGTQWSLKLEYGNRKLRKYYGNNVYPWNFWELCQLLGVEWSRPA